MQAMHRGHTQVISEQRPCGAGSRLASKAQRDEFLAWMWIFYCVTMILQTKGQRGKLLSNHVGAEEWPLKEQASEVG